MIHQNILAFIVDHTLIRFLSPVTFPCGVEITSFLITLSIFLCILRLPGLILKKPEMCGFAWRKYNFKTLREPQRVITRILATLTILYYIFFGTNKLRIHTALGVIRLEDHFTYKKKGQFCLSFTKSSFVTFSVNCSCFLL